MLPQRERRKRADDPDAPAATAELALEFKQFGVDISWTCSGDFIAAFVAQLSAGRPARR